MSEAEKISNTIGDVVTKILAESKKQRDLQSQHQDQEKHREETETIIDKLQDKTQLIDYARQYEHYTDADYKEDVELEVEEHLSETANDLSEDATYYNSDIDSVHTNNELMDNKLKEEEIKIRNTADKRVQEKKDLIKNI